MLTVDRHQKFQEYRFQDLLTLAEAAEKLVNRALELGLISRLTLHLFPDCWQLSLTNGQELELLTPEGAYLRFKKLVIKEYQI